MLRTLRFQSQMIPMIIGYLIPDISFGSQQNPTNEHFSTASLDHRRFPVRKYENQIVGGTREDAQGERLSKEFLHRFCSYVGGKRIPLHQQHDMARKTAGFIENVRLVPDTETPGEWNLIGDISIEEGDVEDLLGGFSISGMEELRRSSTATALIYLPFPHYNDKDLVAELCSDTDLTVGKWIKKEADPTVWTVLGSVIVFAVAPSWDDIYKRKIAPRLDELIKKYREPLNARGLSIELVQIVLFKGAEVEVRIIPTKGDQAGCLQTETVQAGLQRVVAFLNADVKANNIGVNRIVIFYDVGQASYCLHRIEYSDGHVEHMV